VRPARRRPKARVATAPLASARPKRGGERATLPIGYTEGEGKSAPLIKWFSYAPPSPERSKSRLQLLSDEGGSAFDADREHLGPAEPERYGWNVVEAQAIYRHRP
jgi:hypothetical protein